MKKKEIVDLAILIVYPIIMSIVASLLKINLFVSIILFILIPSVFLSIRLKENIKNSLVFSVVFGLISITIVDYIAHQSGSWAIPDTIFPFNLFGLITIEVALWAILMIYFVVMFYEYFLDKHITRELWSSHFKYLVILLIVFLSIFLVFLGFYPELLNIPYFYLILGLIFILLPVCLELFHSKKLFVKFFKAQAYFFYFNFIYEILGVRLGWWEFPGPDFIGDVSVLGASFPIEELFFWIILGALAILTYFEFFDRR